jgi:hypothetical protein
LSAVTSVALGLSSPPDKIASSALKADGDVRRQALQGLAMTLTHRAFAFDHAAFDVELRPLLLDALVTNDTAALAAFIDRNLAQLTEPDEGAALSSSWRDLLTGGDVNELGDFALTKFYDGDLDIGLDADWQAIGDLLEGAGSTGNLMLGASLGPESAPFDPSGEGSYFQTEVEVAAAERELLALLEQNPGLAAPLAALRGMLGQAVRQGRGLYVTF